MYDVIFSVVVYKNTEDLIDFFSSIQNTLNSLRTKVVVVNNQSTKEVEISVRRICKMYSADLLLSENKGYSAGNNLAIQFIKDNYDYKFLIVSNPDIIIREFDIDILDQIEADIIAPKIICSNKKNQNPMFYNYMPISEYIIYKAFKNDSRFLFFLGVAYNKVMRSFYRMINTIKRKKRVKIYAPHGSFIIFRKLLIDKLKSVFDENIFLLCEESDLAMQMNKSNVISTYTNEISVFHKEDGSMKLANINTKVIHKKSYLYYYKKWYL